MGLLIDGQWRDRWYDTESHDGEFVREESSFRSWVTRDGSPGPSGEGGFPAEPGRYRLYVSYACPWAHRTLITRALKGLEDVVPVSVVNPEMLERGWTFEPFPGVEPDPELSAETLADVYVAADPEYTGRVTTPTLWDRERKTIVSNESSEIVRMLDSAFDDLGAGGPRLRPESLADDLDEVNERVYDDVNNGVYKAGFATRQEVYERHVRRLFETLDWLEGRLSKQRFLFGDAITEADARLFPTLLRFDPVYYGHFKCNLHRLADYPALWGYTRDVYQTPGVAETVRMDHIKRHYYYSHERINPTRIVPVGPELDLEAPHLREQLSQRRDARLSLS